MENLLKQKSPSIKVIPPKPAEKYVDVIAQKYTTSAPIVATKSKKAAPKITKNVGSSAPHLPNHLRHLPTLFLALFFYGVCVYVFRRIEPTAIQNMLLANSYVPLLLLSGLGHFFFFSFLFLQSRRGLLVALALTVLLFLRVQQVLTLPIFLAIFLFSACLELLLTTVERHG